MPIYKIIAFGAVMVALAGCSSPVLKPAPLPKSETPAETGTADDPRLLAGEWEYEDGAVVLLKLDERGNGPYAWKEGRFETRSLAGRIWQGMWFQRENDREGGFAVELSSDLSEGEGRWWYTRIGTDQAPKEKGGTFHLSRKSRYADSSGAVPR